MPSYPARGGGSSARRRLERALATEHDAIARLYTGKPERPLGHVTVWDPAIGRFNLVQVLRIGVHHDQHHYRAIRHMLARPDPARAAFAFVALLEGTALVAQVTGRDLSTAIERSAATFVDALTT